MNTKPAWHRAWNEASDWRGTASFWLFEAFAAVAGAVVFYFVSEDWGMATIGLVAGPVALFLAAYLWRWKTISSEERMRSIAVSVVGDVTRTGDPKEAQRAEVRARFAEYFEMQHAKLEGEFEQLKKDPDGYDWGDFGDLAWRTVTGLSSLSEKVGEYLTLTLEEERRRVERSGKNPEMKLKSAAKFLESMDESMGLFVSE